MEHFSCRAQLHGQNYLFIWYCDQTDGVVKNDAGKVVTFASEQDAKRYLDQLGLQLQDQDAVPNYDFNAVARWCASPDGEVINCSDFLNTWNMLGDLIGQSVGPSAFKEADRRLAHIYDRLFWGGNLPSITPEGEHFTPAWSDEDVQEIARLFTAGVAEISALFEVEPYRFESEGER